MDYEIDWRNEASFAARLEILKTEYPHGKFRFRWEREGLLLYELSPFNGETAWVCDVVGILTPEMKRNIENFARAKYGLA